MALTYDSTLSTDLAKVRFFVGDTTSGSGPKPAKANFADSELTELISIAGSWQKAVPLVLRTLANLWSGAATRETISIYTVQYNDRAKSFREQADEWDAKSPMAWSDAISWHSTTSSGEEVPTMFGFKQWGAVVEDWKD